MTESKISVGDGATVLGYTDRYAATVIKVSKSGLTITTRRDHAKRTDTNGRSEIQTYEFSPDAHGREETFTLRKNGKWHCKGTPRKDQYIVRVGVRDHYFDFSF